MKFILIVPAVFSLLTSPPSSAASPSPPPPPLQCNTGSPKCCKNVGATGTVHMNGLLKPLNIVLKDPTAIIGLECITLILMSVMMHPLQNFSEIFLTVEMEKGETAPNIPYAARM
ncbi:hypothetical protein BU17DRAFT_93957 [Hysterangium stoloniferum]|nr:hypothetical protein BU17DRAFT_93957 [Hysterangium stoloniferum]